MRLPFDRSRLLQWLNGQFSAHAAEITLVPLAGGSSNLLYRLEHAGQRFVLRCPPKEKYDPTSHNLGREAALLSALGKTDIPHPRLVAFCPDAGVIGTPFTVLTFVSGFSPVGKMPEPFENDAALRREIAFSMVDNLARLSKVDWREIGLEGFGKPTGFLERQVDRWMGQLARYQTRNIPYLEPLAQWLRDNCPVQEQTGLMHGDYSFPNVMIANNTPTRMAAIVDWESSTIGDPLLDLGHLLAGWCDPGETRTYLRDIDWRGMPTREEMAHRYAELTSFSIEHVTYYRALALFKLSIILEGAYTRVLKGQNDYAPHRTLEQRVPRFIEQAWGFTGSER